MRHHEVMAIFEDACENEPGVTVPRRSTDAVDVPLDIAWGFVKNFQAASSDRIVCEILNML